MTITYADQDPKTPQLRRLVGKDGVRSLVALENGRELGVVTYQQFATPEVDEAGMYMGTLLVDPSSRASGVGHGLVAEWCRRMVAAGHSKLFLIREAGEGRPYKGGFGFVAAAGPGEFKNPYPHAHGMTLYVADPPDPTWTPDKAKEL